VALKRGDLVIVAHGEFGRPRPAIVVQADELGNSTSSVVVCPITSAITERLPVRPIIEANAENGLRIRSQVMTDKIFALPRDHVRSVLGPADAGTTFRIDQALMTVLGLAR
jgi:mRNA interferase MazF